MEPVKKFNDYVNEVWTSSNTIEDGDDMAGVDALDVKESNKLRKEKVRDVFETLKKNRIAEYFDLPTMNNLTDDVSAWFNMDNPANLDITGNEGDQLYGLFPLETPAMVDWVSDEWGEIKLRLNGFSVISGLIINNEVVYNDVVIDFTLIDEDGEDAGTECLAYNAEEDVWAWTTNNDGELQADEFGESDSLTVQDLVMCISEAANPESKYLHNFFR